LRNNRSNFGEFVARETIAEKDHYVKLWENMTPLQMIAEWRKGCSCATLGKPEECQECTRGLIDALERNLQAQAEADADRDSDDPRNSQLRRP
jgi:hypothetical protein